jgi:hypothetical protein
VTFLTAEQKEEQGLIHAGFGHAWMIRRGERTGKWGAPWNSAEESNQDGPHCLQMAGLPQGVRLIAWLTGWSEWVDATLRPVGEPFRVSEFEGPGLMIPKWIPPVELLINENKLVLNMAEVSGGIWMLESVDR